MVGLYFEKEEGRPVAMRNGATFKILCSTYMRSQTRAAFMQAAEYGFLCVNMIVNDVHQSSSPWIETKAELAGNADNRETDSDTVHPHVCIHASISSQTNHGQKKTFTIDKLVVIRCSPIMCSSYA